MELTVSKRRSDNRDHHRIQALMNDVFCISKNNLCALQKIITLSLMAFRLPDSHTP